MYGRPENNTCGAVATGVYVTEVAAEVAEETEEETEEKEVSLNSFVSSALAPLISMGDGWVVGGEALVVRPFFFRNFKSLQI